MKKVYLPKSPRLALFLSAILMGLGQFYVRKRKRGVIVFIVGYALVIFAYITYIWVLPVILAFAFWIWNMYDAYTQAKVYNHQLSAKEKPSYID